MIYKLKNISDKDFSFEGVKIPAGEVSSDLSPEVYQRLLAMYWNTVLMPVEDASYMMEEIEQEKKDKKSHHKSKDTPEHKPPFICDICGKEFQNYRALQTHKRFAHKDIKKEEVKEEIKEEVKEEIKKEVEKT